jgi:hypothetical protein
MLPPSSTADCTCTLEFKYGSINQTKPEGKTRRQCQGVEQHASLANDAAEGGGPHNRVGRRCQEPARYICTQSGPLQQGSRTPHASGSSAPTPPRLSRSRDLAAQGSRAPARIGVAKTGKRRGGWSGGGLGGGVESCAGDETECGTRLLFSLFSFSHFVLG